MQQACPDFSKDYEKMCKRAGEEKCVRSREREYRSKMKQKKEERTIQKNGEKNKRNNRASLMRNCFIH